MAPCRRIVEAQSGKGRTGWTLASAPPLSGLRLHVRSVGGLCNSGSFGFPGTAPGHGVKVSYREPAPLVKRKVVCESVSQFSRFPYLNCRAGTLRYEKFIQVVEGTSRAGELGRGSAANGKTSGRPWAITCQRGTGGAPYGFPRPAWNGLRMGANPAVAIGGASRPHGFERCLAGLRSRPDGALPVRGG